MRIQEVLTSIGAENADLVDATAGRVGALPHAREPRAGQAADAKAGEVLLVDEAEGAELADALTRVAADVDVIVLLQETPDRIRVGRVCAALDQAAMRVEWVVPIEHAAHRTAIVATRADSARPARILPYLGGAEPVELTDAAVRSFVGEALISGLVNRILIEQTEARARELEQQIEILRAQRDEELAEERARSVGLQRQIVGLQRQIDALLRSRPYLLGTAMSNVKHHPIRGMREFPARLRGEGTHQE